MTSQIQDFIYLIFHTHILNAVHLVKYPENGHKLMSFFLPICNLETEKINYPVFSVSLEQ